MNKDLHTDPRGPSGIHEDLLVKYLLGETSPDDNARVETWLAADPANKHFYNHFQLIWRESRRLEDSRHLEESRHLDDSAHETGQQEEAAWQKFRQRIHRPTHLQAVKADPLQRRLPTWTKIAAAILIVASVTAVLYITRSSVSEKTVASTTAPLTDTLPDGSLITLNNQTDIQYLTKFNKERTVRLQGKEAFFKIAPDKEKPFKVYTGDITITVLGTSFNVRNKGTTTEIIVETGMVRVTDSLHDVLLHPSEKLILRKGDSTLTKDSASNQLYKYYRTKEFVCDNTPLWQLAESLEETYGVKILISDPSLRQLQINTIFSDQSLEQILSIIKETFRIKITHADNKYILQP